MKILSWNVNGIRAVAGKGFWDWFDRENADIVCLQEVKSFSHQLDPALAQPLGYHAIWHEGERPGYAGTATFSKKKPLESKTVFDGRPRFHEEGRVVETKFSEFTLLNVYFPNGNPRANGEERLSYKLDFYGDFLAYMDELRKKGEKVIVCGDFNVCHKEIDIARPKENEYSIGFLPMERAWMDKIVEHGYRDVFRHFNPKVRDAYTWWSFRTAARERNVGWRIDYFFVSPDLVGNLKGIVHQTNVFGSDHCPLKLELGF